MAAAAAAKSFQSCLTLCDPIDGSPPGSPVPGILQASNTGVGCHFLLQCMKVKSESEGTQSCLTLCDPIDGSPPGSPVPGILQARVLEWGAIAFSGSPRQMIILVNTGDAGKLAKHCPPELSLAQQLECNGKCNGLGLHTQCGGSKS